MSDYAPFLSQYGNGNPMGYVMGSGLAAAMPEASMMAPVDGLNLAGTPTPGADGQGFLGGVGNWFSKNGQLLNTGVQGISALYGIYNANKQLGLMKDNLKFQKKSWDQNLVNSLQAYNTSLEDKIRGRTSEYAGKEGDVQAYLSKNSLKKV
jgi:hypothetical protein